jgi:PAS domain S-box-containing protein
LVLTVCATYNVRMSSGTAGRIPEVFDELEIGITLHDPETAEVLDVNRRLEELYGYTREELREMSVADYSTDDEAFSQAEATRRIRAAAEGEPQTFEWHVERGDGERIWVRVRLNRATIDGDPFVVAEIRDITDKKERERELERQNERLDRFASMVSHDLRNPLQVAKERLAVVREQQENPHFENIARAHERMEIIIEETLTLARQGETIDETEALDLASVLEEWWADTDVGTATLTVADAPTIQCDPRRLRHVFENLFRNVSDHCGDDVTVTVGALDDGFYVADDGPGIPAEKREAIFDAGHTTGDGNTGFGLAIVSEIVDAHGWTVTVTESEAGGARFEFTGVSLAE